jgi:hypothetical protein
LAQHLHDIIIDEAGQDWFTPIFGRGGFTLLPKPERLIPALPDLYRTLTQEGCHMRKFLPLLVLGPAWRLPRPFTRPCARCNRPRRRFLMRWAASALSRRWSARRCWCGGADGWGLVAAQSHRDALALWGGGDGAGGADAAWPFGHRGRFGVSCNMGLRPPYPAPALAYSACAAGCGPCACRSTRCAELAPSRSCARATSVGVPRTMTRKRSASIAD